MLVFCDEVFDPDDSRSLNYDLEFCDNAPISKFIVNMAAGSGGLPANIKELGVDFRRYLERGKFTEELTNALLSLYSEREWPRNPNEYVCRKLAASCNLTLMDDKNNELTGAKDKIKELEMAVARLREELYKCKHEKSGKKSKE